MVEGRKSRSVRISSSEVNLDLKTSREEINEGKWKSMRQEGGKRTPGHSPGRTAQCFHPHRSVPDRSEPQLDQTGQRSQPGRGGARTGQDIEVTVEDLSHTTVLKRSEVPSLPG